VGYRGFRYVVGVEEVIEDGRATVESLATGIVGSVNRRRGIGEGLCSVLCSVLCCGITEACVQSGRNEGSEVKDRPN
jgi:hypothetical protein